MKKQTQFVHYVSVEDARKVATWMKERGGILVWNSEMFGDDTVWTTPATGLRMDQAETFMGRLSPSHLR